MEGGELFDQIAQRGSFTEYEAYQVMQQVADGLHHLHSHGYMHRDLKVPRASCSDGFKVRGLADMPRGCAFFVFFLPLPEPPPAREPALPQEGQPGADQDLRFRHDQVFGPEERRHAVRDRYGPTGRWRTTDCVGVLIFPSMRAVRLHARRQ